MARSTLSIRYDGTTNDYILDITFERGRYVRNTFSPGESYDVTDICTAVELSHNAAFAALVAAGTFAVVQTVGADIGGIAPGQLSVALAGTSPLTAIGIPVVMRFACAASGATGTADDVTLFSSAAPFKMRILDAVMYTSTAGAGGTTAILYTQAAAAGTQLSAAMSTAAAGVSRPAGTTPTATSTIAAAGSMFLRRTDRSHVGTLVITAVREA